MKEKNVFKELEPQAKLPKEMKQKVLDSIETTKLLLNMWDLIATKRVEMNLKTFENIDTDQTNKELPPKKSEE